MFIIICDWDNIKMIIINIAQMTNGAGHYKLYGVVYGVGCLVYIYMCHLWLAHTYSHGLLDGVK